VLLLPRFDKSHVEGDFQFLRNHDLPSSFRTGGLLIPHGDYNAYVSSIVH